MNMLLHYNTGSMPTSYGYTGQRLDPSGLQYFNARYYDASVGAFVTADAAQGPNRYGYVRSNPETFTDPTGKGVCGEGCYFGSTNWLVTDYNSDKHAADNCNSGDSHCYNTRHQCLNRTTCEKARETTYHHYLDGYKWNMLRTFA